MVEHERKLNPALWGEHNTDARADYKPLHQTAQQSLNALEDANIRHRKIEKEILKLCELEPLTTFELSQRLNKPINCLTQPVKTLRLKGFLVLAGSKQNPTGYYADAWKTKVHS